MLLRQAGHARTAVRVLAAMTPLVALLTTGGAAHGTHLPPGTTVRAAATEAGDRVGALFTGGLDGGHFCTASVVRSADRNLIATAAHCLGGDVADTVFVPGYREGEAPYGVWRLTAAYVADSWTEEEDPDADVAFATVAPLDGRQVEEVLGGFPVAPEQPGDVAVTVIGYPRTDAVPLRCTNTTTLFGDTQRRVECPDYSGGTSGSPWLTARGALAGVLGGYEGGGTVPDVSYSAVLGETARALYREAAMPGG
ncbi:trypsin-like serine peptidase [Streptomyces sp. NPDC101132]|uniref:trypsin-like serine peptidase n=1 Tax=Streptomyces sp. NPDC101132 TaxID=3366110 RepID=UPI003815EB6E